MAETAGGDRADGTLEVTADRGHLRASRADREQVIGTLKAAFAQGQLARGDFDVRVSRALASRTYADLAAVRAGLPAEQAAAEPSPRAPLGNGVKWAVSGLITPAVLAAALAADSLPGDRGYAVVALIAACAYFIYWLSAGANMLWEWHSTASPAALPCVRCAHTAAVHHAATACEIRAGSLDVRQRCQCAGYVPPGLSPKSVNLTA
jgi:hypothetical protein